MREAVEAVGSAFALTWPVLLFLVLITLVADLCADLRLQLCFGDIGHQPVAARAPGVGGGGGQHEAGGEGGDGESSPGHAGNSTGMTRCTP